MKSTPSSRSTTRWRSALSKRCSRSSTEGVIVTGVNGTPEGLLAVQDGRLAITVDYALYSMTQLSIELAVRNLNGERLPKQEFYLDADVIDAANVETFIAQRRAWGIM